MDITLTDLEEAINYWRTVRPSQGEERSLSREVNALADVYALMIYRHDKSVPFDTLEDTAKQLLIAWRTQRAT
jgi:hypothetical protein